MSTRGFIEAMTALFNNFKSTLTPKQSRKGADTLMKMPDVKAKFIRFLNESGMTENQHELLGKLVDWSIKTNLLEAVKVLNFTKTQ